MASGKARICYAIRRNEFRCRKEITNLSKEEEYAGFMRFLWAYLRPICAFGRSLLHEDDWTVGRTSSAHPPYFKDGGYLLSSLDSIDRQGEIIICFGRQLEQRIHFFISIPVYSIGTSFLKARNILVYRITFYLRRIDFVKSLRDLFYYCFLLKSFHFV